MTLNQKFYKKNKNGKLEYTTLFDTDIKDEKEKSNKETSPRLQIIDTNTIEYKYIKQGSILIKLCRNQFGMNFRYFYIDNMNYALRWFSPNKKYESSYIKLANIINVEKTTKNMLEKFPNGIIDSQIYKLSLKISYYNDKKKTKFLYVVCKNKLEQKLWLYGLGTLINNQYNTKPNFENYTEYLNDDIYQYSDICCLFYYNYFHGDILGCKIYIQQQSKNNLKLIKKIKKMEDVKDMKDMNDEIKYYITPQINHIQELISTISFLIKNNIYRKCSKIEKKNIIILLFQIEIKSTVSKDIFKVLSKKYKK